MKKQQVYYYLTICVASLLLLLPAFVNGFPLVNSDSASYISSGFIPETPWDRPITYGILLRVFSFNGLSFWLAAWFQAYIVSWLLGQLIGFFVSGSKQRILLLVSAFVLGLGSGLSWICSELIADVYTPVTACCCAVLLLRRSQSRQDIWLYILYFVSVATHLSHFSICTVLLLCLLLIAPLFFERSQLAVVRKKIVILLVLTGATLAIMANSMSKSKHVFFVASMAGKGILKKYLDENCDKEHYRLCVYKDSLVEDVSYFLWNRHSPLWKEGGEKAVKSEYNKIISGSFRSPACLKMYCTTSAVFTLRQLASFRVGDGNAQFPEGSNVADAVKNYLPRDSHAFLSAEQNREELIDKLSIVNLVFAMLVYLSFAVLAVLLLFFGARLPAIFYFLLSLFFLAIIINAWSCGTFSDVNGRYGCRMIWLSPLCALLGIAAIKPRPVKI